MNHTSIITLGAGCFWCTEAVFEQVRGVLALESGYCNGHVSAPTYEQVCTGTTGHNEVVRVQFDCGQLSLREVLEIFFVIHDPTSLNRQGHDVGTQYRSGIYLHDASQDAVVREVWDQVNAHHRGQVVTEIALEQNYHRAESYHQHYFANHPNQGYCAAVIAPKIAHFKATFARKLRS